MDDHQLRVYGYKRQDLVGDRDLRYLLANIRLLHTKAHITCVLRAAGC
jgi:hypothetical protein